MLVLAWASNDETAFRLPRAAALRLLNKGVLHMEGDLPDWVPGPITIPAPAAPPSPPAPTRQRPVMRPAASTSRPATSPVTPIPRRTAPAALTPTAPTSHPARSRAVTPPPALRRATPPAAKVPPAPATAPAESARNDRFNAIARIIRKLTGGDSASSPAKATG